MSLVEQIRAIERKYGRDSGAGGMAGNRLDVIPTGWPAVDAALGGGLQAGALHEWFGLDEPAQRESRPDRGSVGRRDVPGWKDGRSGARAIWSPPVCLLVHLARQALTATRSPAWVVWIGARCFPYPGVLVRRGERDAGLLGRSLFVAPRDADARLWAIDLAVRSPAVAAVVADGGSFSMAATRRVQLLAKRHQTLVLAARPPWERQQLSAAQTRWWIHRQPYVAGDEIFSVQPRWIVELLRCKGVQWQTSPDTWASEWRSGTSTVHLSPEVAHPACPAAQETDAGPREPNAAARPA